MPLSFHPWAKTAAIVSACVSAQSTDAFWKLHDYAFANQESLSAGEAEETLMREALEYGVDSESLKQCLHAARHAVRATPTLFINDLKVEGIPVVEQLKTLMLQKQQEAENAGQPK